jgi:predicted metalloendopeptidase
MYDSCVKLGRSVKWKVYFPVGRLRINSTASVHRWKGCTGNVNSNFGMAVSYLYVQKHFNSESREKVCSPIGKYFAL